MNISSMDIKKGSAVFISERDIKIAHYMFIYVYVCMYTHEYV